MYLIMIKVATLAALVVVTSLICRKVLSLKDKATYELQHDFNEHPEDYNSHIFITKLRSINKRYAWWYFGVVVVSSTLIVSVVAI